MATEHNHHLVQSSGKGVSAGSVDSYIRDSLSNRLDVLREGLAFPPRVR